MPGTSLEPLSPEDWRGASLGKMESSALHLEKPFVYGNAVCFRKEEKEEEGHQGENVFPTGQLQSQFLTWRRSPEKMQGWARHVVTSLHDPPTPLILNALTPSRNDDYFLTCFKRTN